MGVRANPSSDITDMVMLGVDQRENSLLGSYLFCSLGSKTLGYLESQGAKESSNGIKMIQTIYKYRFGAQPGRAAELLREVSNPSKGTFLERLGPFW